MTEIGIEDITSNVATDEAFNVTGDGIFDDMMETINTHIKAQFDAGRVKAPDIATMYIGIIPSIMQQATGFVLQKELTAKDTELKNIQVATAERQLAEDDEKWVINKGIMENQRSTSDLDLQYKEPALEKALEQQDKTIESMETDIAFNDSKRIIMEYTRADNVRMKATEQYAEFLKYISAADLVVGKHHFRNLVNLITNINDGIANPSTSYTMIDISDIDPDTIDPILAPDGVAYGTDVVAKPS